MAGTANREIEQFLKKAWLLGEKEIDALKPGDEGKLPSLLDRPAGPDTFTHPLLNVQPQDVENPHVHLLRIISNPANFAFTCQHIFGVTILPFQSCILTELWYHAFPMLIGCRGLGKSFILAMYMMLRALICQGVKIVIVGSAFRQAKYVFEYCEAIWANAPVLRDLCAGTKGRSNRESGPRRDIDRCELIIGESVIIALPLGDGKKIRGQRANIIVSDEFSSIAVDIFETVIKGFASVTQDPVGNVQIEARKRVLTKLGKLVETEKTRSGNFGNQSIIAGTADYAFKDFAKYWARYKKIIESRGDHNRLADLSPDGEVSSTLNWKDYVIVRMPVELVPKGFMDDKQIASAKMMTHSSIYLHEYGAVFSADSDGFFKRSLIESCVASPKNQLKCVFSAMLAGDEGVKHVMGVDPAAQSDNFGIVIVGVYPDGTRRIVHCWTTKRRLFVERQKAGLTQEKNFYYFAARKIRELLKVFRCERIVMDAQGGGISVEEALHDTDKLLPGEQPIWQIIDDDPKKRKDSDARQGLHILEMFEFANAEAVSEANHGLKKDLEDRTLLFPHMDAALLGLSVEEDKAQNRLYDTFEDATMEIEALKDELSLIEHTATATGRDRWDVPQVRAMGRRGRMRKDRYSALVMANWRARKDLRTVGSSMVQAIGGWAHELSAPGQTGKKETNLYVLGDGWSTIDDSVLGTVINGV